MTAKRAQIVITNVAITSSRTMGYIRSDEEIARENGYQDLNEYWQHALSEEISASKFVKLLFDHQRGPMMAVGQYNAPEEVLKMNLSSVMHRAMRTDKPWLKRDRLGPLEVDDNLDHWRVDPRAAAEWWMNQPLDVDLLPASLRNHLGEGRTQSALGVRGGAPPHKRNVVEQWMIGAGVRDGSAARRETASGLAGAFIAAQPAATQGTWIFDSVRRMIGEIWKKPVIK